MNKSSHRPVFNALWAAVVMSIAPSLWSHASAEPQSHSAMVATTLEKHIIPRVEGFATAAGALPGKVQQVCQTGDPAAREELSTNLRRTVEAWAEIEFLRFGPLTEAGRRERISFWPDPRGFLARQLRQLIAAKDMKVIEGGAIAKQSAAVQGLPALESVMTDTVTPLAPGAASAFQCALAQAVAANIADMGRDLLQSWTKAGGWKDKMLRPGSDNDTYKEPSEAASELIKALLIGFQLVGDGEIKPQLDENSKYVGPFAKANLSKAYYAAGVKSLQALYETMALESYLPEDKDWVKNWAGGAWRVILASDGAGGKASGTVRDDAPALRELHGRISGLRKLVAKEISQSAGLTVGFNELDGD
jgi:uncharacterized protein